MFCVEFSCHLCGGFVAAAVSVDSPLSLSSCFVFGARYIFIFNFLLFAIFI